MKTVRINLLMIAFLAMGLTFTACNSSNGRADKTGKEYTSQYICPMHCPGSGGDEPGKCSVCGMDMVKNKDYKKEGSMNDHTNHDHDANMFTCPMHPEETGMEGDKCSICGMDMKHVDGEDHKGHNH